MDLTTHPALQVFQMVLNFLDQNIWPLIILVIVIVARKGIGRFVERMTKLSFSVGSATGGAEAVDRIIVADLPSRAEVDQKSSPPEAPKLEISDVKEKAEEGGDWFVQLYALFVSGDSAAATEVFEKQQRIEQDADQRFTNEALFFFLRYKHGKDAAALARLEDLRARSTNDRQRYDAADWLASAYVAAHDFKQAERVYGEALSQIEDVERRTVLVVSLAAVHKENGDVQRGINLLEDHLQRGIGNEQRAVVFSTIASLEEYRGNNEAAAIALEMSLESSPGDRDKLFQAAYRQSEAKLQHLSVSNYETLLDLDPNHALALNNLGVIAHEFKLSGKSIELYQKSADARSTLAMANLANKLIDSGFWKQAQTFLDQARVMESVHENVGHALYRLQTSRNQEQKGWEDLVREARSFQRRVRAYGMALFNNDSVVLAGTWYTSTRRESAITETDQRRISRELERDCSGACDN